MPKPPRRPLIVRLRNWVGDVTLGVPMLQRLDDAGYSLQCVGKGWAADLLAGHGWPVEPLAKTFGDRLRQLRRLAQQGRAADETFDRRINAVCFPYSFGSAAEMRLAGMRAIGHAYEARGWLLGHSVPRPQRVHELEIYWDLGNALLGTSVPPPAEIDLKLAPQHLAQATMLRARHGIEPGYIVICPFAGGTWDGLDKTWPDFAAFVAEDLAPLGRDIIVCPGPGEEQQARDHFASATLLPSVALGTYAALLQQSALMISNDTGPGHMAAAVGAPLLSVLGPSDPVLWRAWGPSVRLLKGENGWPTRAEALAAAQEALAPPR